MVRLIRHAEQAVQKARADDACTVTAIKGIHRAEQLLLLVRLAADTGVRRGELAAVKIGDLEGRVLHIARVPPWQIGPTKTGRTRRLTIGTTTATLWHDTAETWRGRLPKGRAGGMVVLARPRPPQPTHHLAPGSPLGQLRIEAGVPSVTMHRLRHSVATFLVNRGDILKPNKLGHKDPFHHSSQLRPRAPP